MRQTTLSVTGLASLALRPLSLMITGGPVAVGSALAYRVESFKLFPALGCLLCVLMMLAIAEKGRGCLEQQIHPTGSCVAERGRTRGIGGRLLRLALSGYAECFVFVLFGMFTVCASYYLQTKNLTPLVLLTAIPPGLIFASLMLIRSLRDFDRDRKSGKISMAITFGRYRIIRGYKIALLASYLIPVALAATGRAGALILLPLCTLPMARLLLMKVECDLDVNLNKLFTSTVRFSFMFCLMLSFGLIYQL